MPRNINSEIGISLQEKAIFVALVAERDDLRTKYAALLADVTAIRTALIATTAKLDADATVTDADYGSLNNPAALTATALAAVQVTA